MKNVRVRIPLPRHIFNVNRFRCGNSPFPYAIDFELRRILPKALESSDTTIHFSLGMQRRFEQVR
jgi:hypothetical protein